MIIAIVLGVWIGRSRRADMSSDRSSTRSRRSRPSCTWSRRWRCSGLRDSQPSSPRCLRVPDRDQAGRRRHPRRVRHDRGGGPASGITRWQMILKVQIPMARVRDRAGDQPGTAVRLSMVVIGGLVGAGSLGYLVVSGFSQDKLFGKGLAAGIAHRRSGHDARPHRPRCGRPWAHLMVRLTFTTTRHPAGSAKEEGRMARRRLRLPGLMSVAAAIALALSACGGGSISTNAKAAA